MNTVLTGIVQVLGRVLAHPSVRASAQHAIRTAARVLAAHTINYARREIRRRAGRRL